MAPKLGFSIVSLATYEWPVDVKVPFVNEDGEGDYEVHRFTGLFKHLSNADANTMLKDMHAKVEAMKAEKDGETETDMVSASQVLVQNQIDLYAGIWQGWRDGVTDEHGVALPCNEETKRQLLGQRMIREAVMEAHRASQSGEAVRAKNSKASPEDGQQTGES